MAPYFPRHTADWKIQEPPALRRFSMSIVEMAIVTGVLLRLYRALALTTGPTGSWVYLGTTFVLGSFFFFGMATLHLGNYPLRHWLWRAPVFAAIEATVESLTSLGLILAHREPMGSERAHLHEWAGITASIFFWRLVGVAIFALVLAGVVQFVRYLLLRHENRVHTAVAVHEEMVKHE
jgi:hypothetical protein